MIKIYFTWIGEVRNLHSCQFAIWWRISYRPFDFWRWNRFFHLNGRKMPKHKNQMDGNHFSNYDKICNASDPNSKKCHSLFTLTSPTFSFFPNVGFLPIDLFSYIVLNAVQCIELPIYFSSILERNEFWFIQSLKHCIILRGCHYFLLPFVVLSSVEKRNVLSTGA